MCKNFINKFSSLDIKNFSVKKNTNLLSIPRFKKTRPQKNPSPMAILPKTTKKHHTVESTYTHTVQLMRVK